VGERWAKKKPRRGWTSAVTPETPEEKGGKESEEKTGIRDGTSTL